MSADPNRLRRSIQHLISDPEAERRYFDDLRRKVWRMLDWRKIRPSKKKAGRYRKRRPQYRKVTGAFSRYRERSLPGEGRNIVAGVTKLGTFTQRINNAITVVTNQVATGSVVETLQLQRTWDQVNPGPPYRDGGPFKSLTYRVPSAELKGYGTYTSSQFAGLGWRSDWEYKGRFSCGSNWGSDGLNSYVTSGLASFPSLSAYHSRAWDQLKPKLSAANVAQFAYELRDLPGQLRTSGEVFHHLWKDSKGDLARFGMSPKTAADNFLNHQFGWAPFISDIVKMWNVFNNSAALVAQSIRDNNTWIKRSRVLEELETVTPILRLYGSDTEPSDGTLPMAQMCAPMTVDGINCKGLTDIHVHALDRIWATGSFKYYRPEFDANLVDSQGVAGDIQRLMTIYGVRITPTVLYKITPWTWLGDWFTGFGKFVERLDDFVVDGLVSRYLYCMRQSLRTVTKTCMINFSGSGPLTLIWQRNITTKQREVADSPYGFNVPWAGINPTQMAILGALGFSRTNSGFISRG